MTFPTAGASVFFNEIGEPLGWDYPDKNDPWEPDDFDPWASEFDEDDLELEDDE